MNISATEPVGAKRDFDFLRVDDFLRDFLPARALATAFRIGLIDHFLSQGPALPETLAERFGADPQGMNLLLDQLLASRVIADRGGKWSISEGFRAALAYRDLLELKLEMADFGAFDILRFFPDLLCRPAVFARKSDFCGLFAYDRCFERGEEALFLTRRWMRITTVLTKYEAQACMKYHDFGRYRRILDVGGNSGEFALRICRSHPDVEAVVFDLPLVCEIGTDHVRGEPEAERISFAKGDAFRDAWPEGFDLVCFKSMLHDWPEAAAKHLLARAAGALRPGGSLLVFERTVPEPAGAPLPYSLIPFLLFRHSYRPPAFYANQLEKLGFNAVEVRVVELEMPFSLVTGSL